MTHPQRAQPGILTRRAVSVPGRRIVSVPGQRGGGVALFFASPARRSRAERVSALAGSGGPGVPQRAVPSLPPARGVWCPNTASHGAGLLGGAQYTAPHRLTQGDLGGIPLLRDAPPGCRRLSC